MDEGEVSLDDCIADANQIIATLYKKRQELAVAATPTEDLLREIQALVDGFLEVVGKAVSHEAEAQDDGDLQDGQELLERAVDDLVAVASRVTSAIEVFERASGQDSTQPRSSRAGLHPQDVGGRATYIQDCRDAIVVALTSFRSRCKGVIRGLRSKPEDDDRRLAR